MKTLSTFLSVVSLLGAAAACTSSASSEPTPSTQAASAEQADLAAQVCEGYVKPVCQTAEQQTAKRNQCLEDTGRCYARLGVPSAVIAFSECMKQRSCAPDGAGNCDCDKSDDNCVKEASLALPASPKRDEYLSACAAKLAECGRGDPGFSDDYCDPSTIFTDAVLEAMTPCFQNTCGNQTIGTCLENKRAELAGGSC
jgi:hypothetical protein